MTDKILLGYQLGSGEAVFIPLHHLVITGMTQLAGKTTTIEALIHRSGLRAVVFKTKRGEKGFEAAGKNLPMFFKEKSDWQYVSSLIEATLREKVKFERSWVIKACKNAHILKEVYDHITEFLKDKRIRGIDQSVYTNLQAYLEIVLPKLAKLPTTDKIEIDQGVNVMDLEMIYENPEVQALIIRSVMEHILEHERSVIVVVPECWKFLPQGRGTPVKVFFERFIREGAAIGNYLWLDTQDLGGVDKTELRSVNDWILGRQRETNEVERTLQQIPLPKNKKPTELDIMNLKIGHFYAACGDEVKLVYVLPAGVPGEMGIAVAKGQATVEQVAKLLDELRNRNHRKEDDIDLVWKEKYDELEKKFKEAEGLRRAAVESHSNLYEANQEMKQQITKLVGTTESLNKELNELRPLVKLKEALGGLIPRSQVMGGNNQVPSEIKVSQDQPSMTITVQRTPLELNSSTVEGKIAILYAESALPTKQFTNTDLNDLFEQHFGEKQAPANLARACDKFTAWGYFEKVKAGARYDYRVKLDPKEAKKKGLLTHIEK